MLNVVKQTWSQSLCRRICQASRASCAVEGSSAAHTRCCRGQGVQEEEKGQGEVGVLRRWCPVAGPSSKSCKLIEGSASQELHWIPEADLEGDHHLRVVHLHNVAFDVDWFDADDDIGVDVVLDNLEVAHLDDVTHIQLPVNSQLFWDIGLWSLVVLRKESTYAKQ